MRRKADYKVWRLAQATVDDHERTVAYPVALDRQITSVQDALTYIKDKGGALTGDLLIVDVRAKLQAAVQTAVSIELIDGKVNKETK